MKDDTISRQTAIDTLDEAKTTMMLVIDSLSENVKNEESKIQIETIYATVDSVKQILRKLPSAQPNNQVHLCDSCRYVYPECPSGKDDVIFGNGKGNDNICACNKYVPSVQSEKFSKVLQDMMDEDYYLYCHSGYSHLDEKDWEWLIEQTKEMEQKGRTDG